MDFDVSKVKFLFPPHEDENNYFFTASGTTSIQILIQFLTFCFQILVGKIQRFILENIVFIF